MVKNFLFYLLIVFTVTILAGCKLDGRITTSSGKPLEGVTIVLSGDANSTTVTNSNGEYEFEMPDEAASYTLTPSYNNFTFNPEFQNVQVSQSTPDVSDINFEGTENPVFTNTLGMTFNRIEPGTFMMGSQADSLGGNDRETPQHEVTLTQAYYMQTTEVTQEQWIAVMHTNPSKNSGCSECPVEQVSWDDVQTYIIAINSIGEGTYRLPTEAEWEYACRAGSTTAFANGELTETWCTPTDSNLDVIGWFCGNTGTTPQPVAGKAPNAWGLYDMHGNVWEWCQDWYGSYSSDTVIDPTGPATGLDKVSRSGGYMSGSQGCRSAFRYYYSPGLRYLDKGFRLVRTP